MRLMVTQHPEGNIVHALVNLTETSCGAGVENFYSPELGDPVFVTGTIDGVSCSACKRQYEKEKALMDAWNRSVK